MKVSELLSDESKWTQKAMARNRSGEEIELRSPNACKWCLFGAILRCYGEKAPLPGDEQHPIVKALRIAGPFGLVAYNDSHTFAEVRELVLKADI